MHDLRAVADRASNDGHKFFKAVTKVTYWPFIKLVIATKIVLTYVFYFILGAIVNE